MFISHGTKTNLELTNHETRLILHAKSYNETRQAKRKYASIENRVLKK